MRFGECTDFLPSACRRHLNLEAGSAKHRPALRRLEWHCRLFAALRTRRPRLRPNPPASARTLRLALLAVLGVVHELFVVKKELLACSENKICPAVNTL